MTLKKRILFMPEGSILAHVGRTIAIARALPTEAVSICFAASGEHAWRLHALGWPVHEVCTRPRKELLGRLRKGSSAFDTEWLRRYVQDELRLLAEIRPDVVVGDFRPTLGISAELLHIPYVCVTNAPWTRCLAVALEPPHSWLPTKVCGQRLLRALRPLIEERVFAWYARPFNHVRRLLGLPQQHDVRDCMCSRELNLVADAPELFPPISPLPPAFRFIGPILWEPDEPLPEWLSEVDRTRPVVYVTMGSTGPSDQIHELAQHLVEMGTQVICTTASAGTTGWPRDIYAIPYGPGRSLCEVADVVVCHAGSGTIYQALSRGKPAVGVPEFHDQELNMQRITAAGLGLAVLKGPSLAADVGRAVERILREPAFAARARAFQRRIQWDGAERAAAAICDLISVPRARISAARTRAVSAAVSN